MSDPVMTAIEPGITARQADAIMDLGERLGLDHHELCHLAQRLTGWGDDWIYWDREQAAQLIVALRERAYR